MQPLAQLLPSSLPSLQAAEAARLAAVQSVAAEVTARWEAAGADRSRWPPAAQEELENLEARLAAMLTALKTAQQQAEEEAAGEREHGRAGQGGGHCVLAGESGRACCVMPCCRAGHGASLCTL